MFGRLRIAAALLTITALPLAAQQSRDDSARVVLNAARVLERRGDDALSQQLLRLLRTQWPESAAAREVGGALASNADEAVSGFGKTGFILYHTALGAWYGVAIPAALDAHGPEPYGAGLLIGAPLGLIGSRLYANRHALTDGQAGVISFSSQFGMWQALGWSTALNIGSETICEFDYCYDESPSQRPFTASLIGATAGIATGLLAASKPIAPGTSTMISHSGYWGAWFGYALTVLGDPGEVGHRRLKGALIGSNIGVLAAIPLAKAWRPTSTRVRLVSAGGLAGGIAGLGVTLLTRTERARNVVSLVGAGSAVGMVAAAVLTHDRPGMTASSPGGDFAPALLSVNEGTRLGFPPILPTMIDLKRPVNGKDRVPGVKIPLVHVQF